MQPANHPNHRSGVASTRRACQISRAVSPYTVPKQRAAASTTVRPIVMADNSSHRRANRTASLSGRRASIFRRTCRDHYLWPAPVDRWPDGQPRQHAAVQHQCVVFDSQPTLRSCVSAGHFEIRHLPIADFGCFRKIVQRHFLAGPTTHSIYHDIEQSPADCFGGLPSRTPPTDPTMRNILRCDMFFHAATLRLTVV